MVCIPCIDHINEYNILSILIFGMECRYTRLKNQHVSIKHFKSQIYHEITHIDKVITLRVLNIPGVHGV